MPWTFEHVLLVRHGETEWNRLGRRQGQLDSPLTEEGIRHAEVVASQLCEASIDAIFSSPLGRARRTAAVIAARTEHPVVVLDDLAEVHHGRFAGLTNADIEARYPGELTHREREKYTWRFPGGESYADADVRAERALRSIAAAGSRAPLLVTHEMLGRMLVRTLLDLTPSEAFTRSFPHGSVVDVSPSE